MILDDHDVFITEVEEAREKHVLTCKRITKFHRLLRLVIVSAGVGWCGSVAVVTTKLIVENWR